MSRSKWKFKCIPTTLKIVKRKIWDRDIVIQKRFINRTYNIYNGFQFFKLKIDKAKVGYKFGEFIYTRKYSKKESFNKKSNAKK